MGHPGSWQVNRGIKVHLCILIVYDISRVFF
jgi:hypothetical protein